MLLFLGAGASKPFGIPDMRVLTYQILKDLKSKHGKNRIIEDIKCRVENLGMVADIEAILSCIDALCDPKTGVKNAGAFACYLSRYSKTGKISYGKKKEDYKTLSKEIREIIKEYCFLPKYEEKINLIYGELFNSVPFDINDPTQQLFVFTTNYDYCFETYCQKKRINFFDGFKLDRGVQSFVGMGNSKERCQICKLHGSSNYVINDRDEIIKTDHIAKPGDRIASGRIVKESMVFPTSEKYFSREPYYSLLGNFKEELVRGLGSKREDGYIVIVGYSFRDIAINNAFIDASNKPVFKKKQIFLIDPFADFIIKNNIPELDKIIEPINKSFEDINKNDFKNF